MATPLPQEAAGTGYRHLVLYDGVCGLCNRLNEFVLWRDRDAVFAFASLQSALGQSLLRRFGKATQDLDTVYVVPNYRSDSAVLLAKSQAVFFVLTMLGGVWRWVALLRVLPTALLDAGYDLIARSRYRFFGRYETCLLPDPKHRKRFIDI